MARKPIEAERHKNLTQRERVWAAARELRTFTLMELQDATSPVIRLHTCKTYLENLVRGGYLVQAGTVQVVAHAFPQTKYRILKDSLVAPRIDRQGQTVTQGRGTLAMWRAMQILKSFDWHDILRASSHPGAPVSGHTAKTYVQELARAGYFQIIRKAAPGTAARYRLVKDTGPHPPAVTRKKQVFDRNEGQFYCAAAPRSGDLITPTA